jgi:hypothetical protein
MKLFQKLDNLFAASAFAEEGEFDTAREIAAESVDAGSSKPAIDEVKLGTPSIKHGQLASKA